MQRKIEWLSDIGDKPDTYGNVYINMKFDDGTLAYKAGKPADMEQHHAALADIIKKNELVEFELEDTGKKTQKGDPKYKLVGYPGWSAAPAQGGGGGGKSWSEAWYSSEAGVRYTQERTDRRTALMQAVALLGTTPPEGYGDQTWDLVADAMYKWLRDGQGNDLRGEGQQDATVPTPKRPSDPIPASTPSSPLLPGEGQDRDGGTSEGGGGSSGPRGSDGLLPLEDDNPWAGLDVVDSKP
jgi:hypothetical protein